MRRQPEISTHDKGDRLHNFYYSVDGDQIIFYLVWSKQWERHYAPSFQFYDQDMEKVHNSDNVLLKEPVSVYTVDRSNLSAGNCVVKLILYDFEIGASLGGMSTNTQQRFERELEISAIEL